jgi:formylglycine-generating enzyme required for sulfatase activity
VAGKTNEPTREELLARIAALEAQVAAMPAASAVSVEGHQNQLATSGGIAVGSATNSLFVTGEIRGDVYLGKPTDDSTEALAMYRRVLVSRHRHVVLRGIVPPSPDRKAGDDKPELARVYVELDTKSLEEPEGSPDRKRGRAEPGEAKRLSALAATIRHRRMVLLGDPGSGKSTFVTHLGLCLAAHAVDPQGGWIEKLPGWPKTEATLLPICVVLRDFARSPDLRLHPGALGPDALLGFLRGQLRRQNLDFAAKPIEEALERGQALLILDGLDEIAGPEDRERVRDAVQAFSQRYQGCRLLATCRTLSYQIGGARLAGLPSFELAPFDQAKIARFVEAWYEELGRLGEVRYEDVKKKTEALQAAVRRPDILRLAPNPLLLAVMAVFHAHRGRLPDQRALLYEETIQLLLWNWEQARAAEAGEEPILRQLLREAGRNDGDLYRTLARRAFLVHRQGGGQGDGPADIGEIDLIEDLRLLHPKQSWDWAHAVLDAIRLRAGLLIERTSGIFAFPHRTFQEYLAAAHLAGKVNFATEALDLARRDLALGREILLLAAGKLAHHGNDVEKPLTLVDALCPVNTDDSELGWYLYTLAGAILVEIGARTACTVAGGEEKCDRVRGRLVALIEQEKLRARERAAAGDVLAAIGDPRFRGSLEYCLPADDMCGFVEIPEGPLLMGSDRAKDGQANDGELPQHRIELPDFLMARFPVTVAQFRAYLEATHRKIEDERGLRAPDTRPVTWVSLDEALEYCTWLDNELRLMPGLSDKVQRALDRGKVTLPSEAEWEKAARGTDGRTFPWGDGWNPERANVKMSIGTTSAVGCFRGGRSPSGCEDMVGNVWEWTRSRYQSYPYPADARARAQREAPGGHDGRVVRGASFYYSQRYARAAYRDLNHPAALIDDLGFRVVVSPSVPCTPGPRPVP